MSENKLKKTAKRSTSSTKKRAKSSTPKKANLRDHRWSSGSVPPEPLSKEDKAWVDSNLREEKDTLTAVERRKISELHAKAFRHKFAVPCTCSPKTYKLWKAELLKLSSLQ